MRCKYESKDVIDINNISTGEGVYAESAAVELEITTMSRSKNCIHRRDRRVHRPPSGASGAGRQPKRQGTRTPFHLSSRPSWLGESSSSVLVAVETSCSELLQVKR